MSSILYFAVAYLVPIVILLIIYNEIRKFVKKDLRDSIRAYFGKEAAMSRDLENFIIDKKDAIISIGSFVWPLTIVFMLGYAFGDDIYQLITDKSYENRIGAWFV